MEETKQVKKIKVYTSPTCHYCHMVKDFMKERDIDFEEVDISQDPAALEEMVKKTGHMGVPVIEGMNDEIIVGFNQEALEKMIEEMK